MDRSINDNKVLIITGRHELRPIKYAEYLQKAGFHPIVVTARNPTLKPNKKFNFKGVEFEVIYTLNLLPFLELVPAILRRLRLNKLRLSIPDMHIGWIPHTLLKCADIIKKENVGLILVSCQPWTAALIGACLKKWSDIPYVLELRDPWTLNEYQVYPSITRKINEKLEVWAFKMADRISIVSETWREEYITKYP